MSNVECHNCGLIFKKKWFNRKYLNFIFNKLIPIHPKGWDKLSKKFSKKYFLTRFKSFTLNKNNEKNYFFRELVSIIDSIHTLNKKKNEKILRLKKKYQSSNNLEISEINYLANSIKNPEPFKRFSGFGGQLLFNAIEKKIGIIKNYSEIGCPLWGNFQYIYKNRSKINCHYIKPDPENFWGKLCKKKNISCHCLLPKEIKIYESLDKSVKKEVRFDFISVFLYLDHIVNPIKFLTKLEKISKSIGFILEPCKKGVPMQHFTGWNKKAIKFLANKFNYKIYDLSHLLKNINHSFFIFYK
jgi:hypothetical protein